MNVPKIVHLNDDAVFVPFYTFYFIVIHLK